MFQDTEQSLASTLLTASTQIPTEGTTLRSLFALIGEQGMLMFCMVLTIPFLLPVSIPGVSTVFGLLITLIGVGVTLNRVPWLPRALMDRHLNAEHLVPALERGAKLFARFDRVIRPRWLAITHGATINRVNGLALVLAGLLLMAPLGFIPFSNTIPALACLFLAAGMLQRDGLFVLAGYLALAGTLVYFGALIVAALVAGNSLRGLIRS